VATRREALEGLRDRLTDELERTEGRDLATISKELRAVWGELDGLPVEGSKAPADELKRQREERRKRAAGA